MHVNMVVVNNEMNSVSTNWNWSDEGGSVGSSFVSGG